MSVSQRDAMEKYEIHVAVINAQKHLPMSSSNALVTTDRCMRLAHDSLYALTEINVH